MPAFTRSIALCSDPKSWIKFRDGRIGLPFALPNGASGKVYRAPDTGFARAVRPGYHERPTYLLASPKSATAVYCESALERDAYLHLEFDPSVASYRVQPYTVEYDQPRVLKTYPDAEVMHIDDSREILQVKLAATYEKHLSKPHFRGEAALFRSLGWKYRVMTEVEIRREPRLENLKLLHYYRGLVIPEKKTDQICNHVLLGSAMTIKRLTDDLKRENAHLVEVVSLIARGRLAIDLDTRIDDACMVHPV